MGSNFVWMQGWNNFMINRHVLGLLSNWKLWWAFLNLCLINWDNYGQINQLWKYDKERREKATDLRIMGMCICSISVTLPNNYRIYKTIIISHSKWEKKQKSTILALINICSSLLDKLQLYYKWHQHSE